MTILTDLQAAIDAEIISKGFTGTLAELGINQPYAAKLITLLQLRSLVAANAGTANLIGEAAPEVKVSTSAQLTRGANVTPYTAGDTYFSVGYLPNLATDEGSSILFTDFEARMNMTAIPSGYSLRLLLFPTATEAQFAGAAILDNSPLVSASNAIIPTIGINLTSTLDAVNSQVKLYASVINQVVRLAPAETGLYYHLRVQSAFTPANPSETLVARARAGTY
jgi:hypothetical protein